MSRGRSGETFKCAKGEFRVTWSQSRRSWSAAPRHRESRSATRARTVTTSIRSRISRLRWQRAPLRSSVLACKGPRSQSCRPRTWSCRRVRIGLSVDGDPFSPGPPTERLSQRLRQSVVSRGRSSEPGRPLKTRTPSISTVCRRNRFPSAEGLDSLSQEAQSVGFRLVRKAQCADAPVVTPDTYPCVRAWRQDTHGAPVSKSARSCSASPGPRT